MAVTLNREGDIPSVAQYVAQLEAVYPESTLHGNAGAGATQYEAVCVTCHGPQGAGDGPVGKTLNPPPRNFQEAHFLYGGTDQDIFDVITNGAASKGGSALMAPWGAVIPEADR